MAKFNKWLAGGLGWAFFGPLGGLLGFVVASAFDGDARASLGRQDSKTTTTTGDFVMSMLVLVAAVMKADGKVLKVELDYVKAYFLRSFGQASTEEALKMLKNLLGLGGDKNMGKSSQKNLNREPGRGEIDTRPAQFGNKPTTRV